MISIRWQPAPAELAAECERLFQAGGPRVYLQAPGANCAPRPTDLSARHAAKAYGTEETVIARRKLHGVRRYEWFCATITGGTK